MKPLATLNRPVLKTVDTETKEESVSFKERTDVTAVPAAGVVAETMVALVLASEALRKFGGDSMTELVRNHDAYRASLRDETNERHLVLVGSDGRGQDDGRAGAARSGSVAPFVDTDDLIMTHAAMPIDEIWRDRRRGARSASSSARWSPTCARRRVPLVIACGGGTVVDAENRRRLRDVGIVVWLRAPDRGARGARRQRRAAGRCSRRSRGRARPPRREREPTRTPRPPTRSSTPTTAASNAVAAAVLDAFAEQRMNGAASSLGDRSYDVVVDESLRRAGRRCSRGRRRGRGRHRRPRSTTTSVRSSAARSTAPASPTRRSRWATARTPSRSRRSSALCRGLHASRACCAATPWSRWAAASSATRPASRPRSYYRGIDVVQVPTTLLAMVDSAIGGKTGVNLPEGKNLVGAFHQPIGVFANPRVLASLPDREYRCGLGEIAKYALMGDDFVSARVDALVARDPATLADVIARCAAIKARCVEADELERTGCARGAQLRAHARRTRWRPRPATRCMHGEAVAIGLVFAGAARDRARAHRRPSSSAAPSRSSARSACRCTAPPGLRGRRPADDHGTRQEVGRRAHVRARRAERDRAGRRSRPGRGATRRWPR